MPLAETRTDSFDAEPRVGVRTGRRAAAPNRKWRRNVLGTLNPESKMASSAPEPTGGSGHG